MSGKSNSLLEYHNYLFQQSLKHDHCSLVVLPQGSEAFLSDNSPNGLSKTAVLGDQDAATLGQVNHTE